MRPSAIMILVNVRMLPWPSVSNRLNVLSGMLASLASSTCDNLACLLVRRTRSARKRQTSTSDDALAKKSSCCSGVMG